MYKKIIYFFIHLCVSAVGLVFLYSAYSKLDPVIETFEMTFVRLHITNWTLAPWVARFMIGLEIFTGFLLVMNYQLKGTATWTIIFLMIFNSYLMYQMASGGSDENCGCFGEVIKMNPAQALLKNFIMIMALLPVYYMKVRGLTWKRFNALFLMVLFGASMFIPHVINPVFYDNMALQDDEMIGKSLPLDLLYENRDRDKVDSITVDLRQGKHVVAFLSLTCPHCRIAAKKINVMKELNSSLPFYFILNGDKPQLSEFMKDTKCYNIPYSFVLGKTFVRLAGINLPRIYYLDNGILKAKHNHVTMEQSDIEDFIKN